MSKEVKEALENAILDAKKVTEAAKKNAAVALKEAFSEKYGEETLDEKTLDEVIDELEQEVEEEAEETRMVIKKPKEKKRSNSYWKNLKYLWYYPYVKSPMVRNFQARASITPKCVARLTLPDNTRVEFTELPKWHQVLRYQLSGFKFEVFHLDDNIW